MLKRLSLRTRLVLGVLAVATVGLVVADVATYTSLRSFLFDRVDSTLDDDHRGVESLLRAAAASPEGVTALPALPAGLYAQIRSSGRVLTFPTRPFPGHTAPLSPPKLPTTIRFPAQAQSAHGPDRVRYFTTGSQLGDTRYRVRASLDPGSNAVLIVATTLRDVDSTLQRLFWIMLLVTLVVLAAIVGLGLWIVRLGLRPLEQIGRTADAITAGDLSRRVEPATSSTEVGRLGLALNAMLGRIEESDRRLRRFVADASHELRTPLAAVRAYAELFGRGADRRPDDLARAMTGISRESERMSVIVEDLLLLARLDEGRPLERDPVDVAEVVREAVETARAVEPGRPIELTTQPAVVLGDRERLRQIVDNLLGNVRAHTPTGTSARVTVATDDGMARIEVEDFGEGIDPDQLERVFERFFRTDSSRSRASGGVGLGLSIVAAVAEAHGGSAAALSQPGSGSTFVISLPLAPSPPA
jgi:two-component system, OmpR family, sensor kinase